jgi:tRNA G18 (ribose-2'-O)-methylase SpoU
MIKIEKISATKATIVRNGARQPLILHSHVSDQELASIEAEDGIVVYSVDEAQVKEMTFQRKPAAPAAVIKQPAARVVKPATKVAEPIPEPTSAKTPSE